MYSVERHRVDNSRPISIVRMFWRKPRVVAGDGNLTNCRRILKPTNRGYGWILAQQKLHLYPLKPVLIDLDFWNRVGLVGIIVCVAVDNQMIVGSDGDFRLLSDRVDLVWIDVDWNNIYL